MLGFSPTKGNEVRRFIFKDADRPSIPRVQAELDAEVGRLCAGEKDQSELETIYRDNPGPSSRKWAISDLSTPRIARALLKAMPGCIEVTAICMDFEIMLELAWSERRDHLRSGAVIAQRKITLPLLRGDRPKLPAETAPNGNGIKASEPELVLTRIIDRDAEAKKAQVAQPPRASSGARTQKPESVQLSKTDKPKPTNRRT